MFEEFKETLRRVLLAKYSIGFIDGYETGKADGYETGYEVGYKEGSEDERKGIRRLSPGEKIGEQ